MQGHEPGVQKYLGKKCKYYIPTPDIPAADAIRLIRTYGKAAFIAHPLIYGFGYKQIEDMLEELKPYGLSGLEVYHSSNNAYESGRLRRSPENTGSSYQEVPTSTVQPNPTYPWEPEGAVFGSRKLYFRI